MLAMLVSCQSEQEKYVSEVEKLTNEYVEAIKNGDAEKAADLQKEMKDLKEPEDLTDEQKEKVADCAKKVLEAGLEQLQNAGVPGF